jgi:hypothetical protein
VTDLNDLHLPYALPTALLLGGLSVKFPTFLRAWRAPDVRATWLVLMWASAVFLSVAPASIHKINTVTGVPNIAAPWVYSLLTAFCGACLTMIITWREEPSPRRQSRVRLVWVTYTSIIVALWTTFLLADVPTERIYDLDTYYANTPWMREHILLYLLAYMVSTLVSAWMIWTWISKVRAKCLKAGLVFLQAGYAFGLVFDFTKLVAIGARWAGTDWDFLSVKVAPPFAILGATLVATGFILPVVGPFLQKWPREQATYWILVPLSRAIRGVAPSSAKARVGRFAPLDLRLMQRQQHIHDGLLRLAPYSTTPCTAAHTRQHPPSTATRRSGDSREQSRSVPPSTPTAMALRATPTNSQPRSARRWPTTSSSSPGTCTAPAPSTASASG